MQPPGEPSVHVHHRGERGVDGILRLIEMAGLGGPLEPLLTAMCVEISAIAEADVATVYVRAPGTDGTGDLLVMRGNHGFPATAIGSVALHVGEGITGLVAECMRPVSVAVAEEETHYKHVPGLGEERFPSFVGVPLLGNGAVIGVLVLQRRRREAFTAAQVTLATALGAPVTLAIERSRAASAPRSARVPGKVIVGGVALGRAVVIPTATALADQPAVDLDRAFARLRDDLDRARRRLGEHDDPDVGRALDELALVLMDQRLRDRLVAAGDGAGLCAVARDYARVPLRAGRPPTEEPAEAQVERAREIEDLCVLLQTSASARPALTPGAVWIGERLGALVALVAVARGAAAVVVDRDGVTAAGAAVARAATLPVLASAAGLFSWARPGDLLVVDGGDAAVQINPAVATVERLRRERAERTERAESTERTERAERPERTDGDAGGSDR